MSEIAVGGKKPKNIKNENLRCVLTILKNQKICTTGEISRESNLSITTVNKILDQLKQTGLVKSLGKGHSTKEGGKKPELFSFNERFKCAVHVNFGQSGVKCVLTDLYSNTIAKKECTYSDKDNLDACCQDLYANLSEMLQSFSFEKADICGISIGIAGIVNSETGNVIHPIHNIKWGSGDRIIKKFREIFPENNNILIENIGRLRAQFVFCGNPELRNKSVTVLSSNVNGSSGAVFKGGVALHGSNGLLGEFGHIVIPDSRRQLVCECGKTNCFEKLVHTEMLPVYAEELVQEAEEPELYRALKQKTITPLEIIRRSDQGSAACRRVMDMIVDYYIIVIQNLMLTCDTECYVFGGIYVENSRYFREELLHKFRNSYFCGLEFQSDVRFLDLGAYDFSGSTLAVIDRYLRQLRFD